MKIFPDKLTDSEYVERLRAFLRRRWIIASFFFGMSLLLFTFIYFISRDLFKIVFELCNMTVPGLINIALLDKTSFFTGIVLGVVIAGLIFVAGNSLAHAIEIVVDNRKDHMLIKYFDEAKKNKDS